MANNISNHFAITALADGITVQGSLRVSGSLSQNYNSNINKCVPDWKANVSTRPKVYAVIRKGTSYVSNAQIVGAKWVYNDVPLVFNDSNESSNALGTDGSPLFRRGTTSVNLNGVSYSMPCLEILNNLASPTNIDIDTIGFEGSIEISGQQSSFVCQVDVKIAQMTSQGFLGQLSPESAIITERGQVVEIGASLFAEDGSQPSAFFTKWYFNNGEEEANLRGRKSVTINEENVTDNIIIKCEFFLDADYNNRVAVAFASIDDTQDPEYLYISFDGSNSDFSGQLSPGDSVNVSMWVATMEDPKAVNTAYNSFTVRFYDGAEQEITSSLPVVSVSNHKATCTLTYDFVVQHGSKVNGVVTAS